jgi:hypothetical protein
MDQPLSFQPRREDINSVPIEAYNKVVKELEQVKNELMRCRQKVAHLLKEKEVGRNQAPVSER